MHRKQAGGDEHAAYEVWRPIEPPSLPVPSADKDGTTGGGRSDGGAATLASARHEKGVWPSGTASTSGGGELGGALGGGDGGGGGNSIRGNVVAHVT